MRLLVSIPFIAGQWSLQENDAQQHRASGRFNPLHCGAVVASTRRRRVSPIVWRTFQSPSLRGSGRFARRSPNRRAPLRAFQSPSLRGSGRFACMTGRTGWCAVGFQSPSLRGSGRFDRARAQERAKKEMFQSPSLRGSGRFLKDVLGDTPPTRRVSIPFIAGQWSLQDEPALSGVKLALVSIPFIAGQWSLPSSRTGSSTWRACFNPLHCGAVVASFHSHCRKFLPACCFNPLHCGAVVASVRIRSVLRECSNVSIPFIAGQWSLRRSAASFRRSLPSFNPLHCGAVVASPGKGKRDERPMDNRFNPLHCGAVVASGGGDHAPVRRHEFQSPSLRGSGRFFRARQSRLFA